MQCYYLVSRDGVARFAYEDPVEPDGEWEAPGLLLQLVVAGCPVVELGAPGDELIELHRDDEDRVLAMTGQSPPTVELHGTARCLALEHLS